MAVGNGVLLVGNMSGGTQKLDLATGTIEELTKPDPKRHEIGHIYPRFLPDLDHFLFTTFSHDPRGPEHHNGYVASLKTREVKLIGDFPSRIQYGGGHLFYVRDGILHARPFDTSRLEMTGEPVPVARDIRAHVVIGSAGL